MAKQVTLSGFIIRVGKGSLQIVKKPGSIYDGSKMVVASYSIYNTRSTRRKLKNEDYRYIIKGHTVKNGVKADYGFYDSLLNKLVDPKKRVNGFVRIPYNGPGRYGVVFNVGSQGEKQSFTWEIEDIANPTNINKEGSMPSALNLETGEKPMKKLSPRLCRKFRPKTKKSKKKRTDDAYYHPDGLDMFDYYTSKEAFSKNEFAHGRKRREEWNSSIAFNLKKELDDLRKLQRSDPNTFDRGAMK